MRKPRFLEFLGMAGREGISSIVIAAILFGVAVYEHVRDHNVAAIGFGVLTVLMFCYGAYCAWSKEHKLFLELQARAAKPQIIFTATSLPDSSWDQPESISRNPPPIFTVTHVGGEPARFIQVQRIQSAREAATDNLYVQFDQIDFLDSAKREAHPNFELFLTGRSRGKGRAGHLGFLFFQMDAARDKRHSLTVDYPITVTFDWNGQMLEEKVTLTWNAATQTLKTSRPTARS